MDDRTILSIIGQQNIVALRPDTTVRAAVKVMSQNRIGAVPVTDRGRLVGIFTERDLLIRVIAANVDADTARLGEVMTPDPQTISSETTIADAFRGMLAGHFRHLPVMRGDKLIGIVSMRDIPPEYWGLSNDVEIAAIEA